jgi:hypothetical protein
LKNVIRVGNNIVAAIIIILTVLAVFMPSFEIWKNAHEYYVHFLLFLILSGIVGLILDNKTVLFTSFSCAMMLALFLKNASNTDLKDPTINDEVHITAAHINLSAITDVQSVINIIEDPLVDIISFQEYTPDWANIIPFIASKKLPYNFTNVRIDLYGKAIFSKHPLLNPQMLTNKNNVNLQCTISINGQNFEIISAYMTPALDKLSKEIAKEEFQYLAEKVLAIDNHLILLGEFNQVYWAHDILAFRNTTGLLNSRRDIDPSKLKMPYNHTFFSNNMECYYFEDIIDTEENYYGSIGSYQLKKKLNSISQK